MKSEKKNLFLKYLFLFLLFSFIGRIYEFDLIISSGSLNYVSFFPTAIYTLIFALPYGVAGLLLYFTIKLLSKNKFTSSFIFRTLACVVIINLLELAIGLFVLNIFGIMPWNYSHHVLNYKGLISLPITIRWTIFSVLFNLFAYKNVKSFIENPLSKKIKIMTIIVSIVYVVYLVAMLFTKQL